MPSSAGSATSYSEIEPKVRLMPTIKKQYRRLPWGVKRPIFTEEQGYRLYDEPLAQEVQVLPGRYEVFRLHGRYVFDPARVTSEDIRRFLWAGLRELRAQARARGLAEEDVQQLLMSAFNVFHDASESMWTALKTVVSSGQAGLKKLEEAPLHDGRFIACEEDIPIPVKMDLAEPLTLLDPDAEVLAAFEP